MGNTVAHFVISNQVNTSPTDFLENAKDLLIKFFSENPNNKIQLGLVYELVKVNTATGEVIGEEQAVFQSRQESVFPTTDLDDTFSRMVADILEAFSTYLRNGSGWALRRVVRLDITISKLNPLKGS